MALPFKLARKLNPTGPQTLGVSHGLDRGYRVTGAFEGPLHVAANARVVHVGAGLHEKLGQVVIEPGGRFESVGRADGLRISVSSGTAELGREKVRADGHVIVSGGRPNGSLEVTGGGVFDIEADVGQVHATGPRTRAVLNTRAGDVTGSEGAFINALHGADSFTLSGKGSHAVTQGRTGHVVLSDGATVDARASVEQISTKR